MNRPPLPFARPSINQNDIDAVVARATRRVQTKFWSPSL